MLHNQKCNFLHIDCQLVVPICHTLNKKSIWKEQTLGIIFLLLCADVCNSTDLPELEIISLLEEQLPVYKLRADTIFGYEQDDWLQTPLLDPDAALDLTTEQIEETLKYFCELSTWSWLYCEIHDEVIIKLIAMILRNCIFLNLMRSSSWCSYLILYILFCSWNTSNKGNPKSHKMWCVDLISLLESDNEDLRWGICTNLEQ